ncbi:T9SS type A sorting domain-containing protein [Sulfidibacter corallicola]|uniref:T9SS type A sorting domain-containing protein n=1 Tax=Sulfidibacter corallicola TaxID=2818388 RepID=A0A8A4TTT2_SULCO|nr:T9SS type A sorting domain-containing protein [Sulfidibacter corallicola]QTD52442.1 T9SS type A sorting domain-containing protein [Sulfidibacter corallicola]
MSNVMLEKSSRSPIVVPPRFPRIPPAGLLAFLLFAWPLWGQATLVHEENFESALSGWGTSVGESDTPNTSGWVQTFGPEAYEGRGYAEVNGYQDDPSTCVVKSKFLITPLFDLIEFETAQLTYMRSWVSPLGKQAAAETELYLIPATADPNHPDQWVRLQPHAIEGAQGKRSWATFIFFVTNEVIVANEGDVRFAIGYRSQEDACDTLRIDLLRLLGLQENQAPDTVILEPASETVNLMVDEIMPLRATTTSGQLDGITFLWDIFGIEDSDRPLATFTGAESRFAFDSEGVYRLTCRAINAENLADPTPAERLIQVGVISAPDTIITQPTETELRISAGTEKTFTAQGVEGGTAADDFQWTIFKRSVDLQSRGFRGASITVPFTMPGIYEVLCQAETSFGVRDPIPARRTIVVDEETVRITSPELRQITVALNERVTFSGTVEGGTSIDNLHWILLPGPQQLCTGETCEITFDKAGTFSVALVGTRDGAPVSEDFVRVHVDPALDVTILTPIRDAEIGAGQPIRLAARIEGRLASADPRIRWTLNGKSYQGNNVDVQPIQRPGVYPITLTVGDPALGEIAQLSHSIYILSGSSSSPSDVEVTFTRPKTDITIPLGEPVFFDARVDGPPSQRPVLFWQVIDTQDASVVFQHLGQSLGRREFPITGSFEVNLFQRFGDEQAKVGSRTITVTDQPGFTPNNSSDEAPEITPGNYRDLTLDDSGFLKINVPENGLAVQLKIEADGPTRIDVWNSAGQQIASTEIVRTRNLYLRNLPADTYLLRITNLSTTKRALSFGFNVEVLNPGLYFSDVAEDSSFTPMLGLVNPNGEEVSAEFIAYDAQGNILARTSRNLFGKGALRDSLSNLFPESADQIAWIRVDSTRDLVGYAQKTDLERTQSYALGAIEKLDSELFVPHIAQDTGTWYTEAAVLNGQTEAVSAKLLAGSDTRDLSTGGSYTRERFDFQDKFGGSLPPDAQWGRFLEENQTAGLAGSEVFGRVDGLKQVAGLSLFGSPADNVNFVNESNTLYFTHIARDVNRFWTGIALVNLSTAGQGALIRAYGTGGALVGEKTMNLDPEAKTVLLAEDFLAGIGSPANVDWVEVIADGAISGYELFGTWDGKQMAGLEAITEIKTEICFPMLDTTGDSLHGFAVVNVASSDAAIVFRIYDEVGGVISETSSTTLPGKAKQIFLLTELFGELPETAVWVQAQADQPIAGFQLLFGSNGETMSGLIAR